MAKRSSKQPLYEYLQQSAGRHETRLTPPEGVGSDQWLRPGRSIRIPVGYVLVAIGIVIILSAAAFIYGFRNGETSQRAEIGDNLFNEQGNGHVAQDPLATGGQIPLSRGDRPPLFQNAPTESTDGQQTSDPLTFGDVESDPRESGLYYFVLMTTRQDGAVRLANFCRENGLEAYVVPVNNGGLSQFQVIAFPGFDDRAGPGAESIRNRISEVGRLWKGKHPRESDLRDAYPVLYR